MLTDDICGLELEQWTQIGIMCGPTILHKLVKLLQMTPEDFSIISDSIFISLFKNR